MIAITEKQNFEPTDRTGKATLQFNNIIVQMLCWANAHVASVSHLNKE